MDVGTIKRIWALESDYGRRDSMSRSAVKGEDYELLELLLQHCGTEAFYGNGTDKAPTDAVITACALGRLDALDWLFSKGLSTHREPGSSAQTFKIRAVELATSQGWVRCLARLHDKLDLFDAKCIVGNVSAGPMSLFINALGNAAAKGREVAEGVQTITALVEQGKLKVGAKHAGNAFKLGLHELLPLLVEHGSAVDLKAISEAKKLEGVSNERLALCFDALRETHKKLKLGSAGRLFCTVTEAGYGSPEKVEPLDKRTLSTKHAYVVGLFNAVMGRDHKKGDYAQLSRSLFELWSAVLPEALDARIAARAVDKRDAKMVDAILGLGVQVEGAINIAAEPGSVSQGYVQQLVDDADVARVLHARGVDLERVWSYRNHHSGDRKEYSILTSALARGQDTEIPLIQTLYELGVDFNERVNGRTITQHATHASEGVKRVIKALKTGQRIEQAFGGPESDTSPSGDTPDLSGGSGVILWQPAL